MEAVVSGWRIPAEKAQLVVMLAGDAKDLREIKPILTPICKEMVDCGPIGNALLMKLSVNRVLTVLLSGFWQKPVTLPRNKDSISNS